ncbi:glyoxylate/hydroxypyruvate reductase A-like [Pollicipes pollicipes]|uniref:glyoxylate/hydroxypyruvate reductase A-like n=1 Tax=Pollicipes pollicipes TaxID=41117 RepID=UPI0018856894|nr:glyoxylate/hydroxypyruvate reductase A-like [Pollicipes pollicipes]
MASLKACRVHIMLPRTDLALALKYLSKNGPESCSYVELPVEGNEAMPTDYTEELQKAEVLLTTPGLLGSRLYSVPKLQWAQMTFAGINELLEQYQPDEPEPPFAITRFASAKFGRELAEWVLAAVLCHERGFQRLWEAQRQHRWAQRGHMYRPLSQLTIGVLGTGQMGYQAGLLFKQLGCRVHGLARTEKAPDEIFDKMFTSGQLGELMQSADYVCNLLPSTPATRGLLSPAVLGQLRGGPVLVNAGRGDLVREADLVEALRAGQLSGAVLDVFETEPLPADSPLWDMEQVTISPHVGNISRLDEVGRTFLDNLERHLAGRPLLHRLDWRRGY